MSRGILRYDEILTWFERKKLFDVYMKSFLVYRLQWEVKYIQAIPGSTIVQSSERQTKEDSRISA